MDAKRVRLAAELNTKRQQLRIKWPEVARQLGMTTQNLLRIRQGTIGVSEDAANSIEEFLGWTTGSVQDLLEGREPRRRQTFPPPPPRHEFSAEERQKILAMSTEQILAMADDLRKKSDYAALLWLNEATRLKAESSAPKTPAVE